jgi:hypothetical protein
VASINTKCDDKEDGWYKPQSARNQAREKTTRPLHQHNDWYFNVGLSSSVNNLHSHMQLSVNQQPEASTPAREAYAMTISSNQVSQ